MINHKKLLNLQKDKNMEKKENKWKI